MDDTASPDEPPLRLAAVVLAAGEGRRMHSALPKVLHSAAGRPLLAHVLATLEALATRPAPTVVVLGRGAEAVEQALAAPALTFVEQAERLGTGHALRQAEPVTAGRADAVLVLYGDVPLLTPDTLAGLIDQHASTRPAITLLSAVVPDAKRYGRLVRDAAGRVLRIVEHAEASAAERAGREINAGVYLFRDAWLWPALARLSPAPGGEWYLTDLVALALADGETVDAVVADDAREVEGVNDRADLAQAERVLRERIRGRHLLAGVSMVDPDRVWIDAGVDIGADTLLWPDSYLLGGTRVGRGCTVGPGSWVSDTVLGDGVVVRWSVLEGAEVGEGSDVGPFAHLRPGARLAAGVHIGNFGEVKNSRLGPGVQMGHFGYVGDAEVGAGANIGAGTVTCNYDGEAKHATHIGPGAFIGSDTLLVAPVRVGAAARTGAGSVVTRDVPDGATAVGVPARLLGERAGSPTAAADGTVEDPDAAPGGIDA